MMKLVNEMAELDVLVVYIACGTGVFNADARRLVGLQTRLPEELMDPSIKAFAPLQKHFNLCQFGSTQVNYADFLRDGAPLICLTIKVVDTCKQKTPKKS